jgi:hypothetical protein
VPAARSISMDCWLKPRREKRGMYLSLQPLSMMSQSAISLRLPPADHKRRPDKHSKTEFSDRSSSAVGDAGYASLFHREVSSDRLPTAQPGLAIPGLAGWPREAMPTLSMPYRHLSSFLFHLGLVTLLISRMPNSCTQTRSTPGVLRRSCT